MVKAVKESNSVLIGKITGVHALKGEVKVAPYGEIDWIVGEVLYTAPDGESPAQSDGNGTTLKVSSARPHKRGLLVVFEGINSIEDAEPLVNLDLFVDKTRLPALEEGEYYQQDLIGMEVFTEAGLSLGKITEIITTGANDIYQVTSSKGETLLPAIKEVILTIDVMKKKMVVRPQDYEPDE
jgi:16S rRNA processing protein RimM